MAWNDYDRQREDDQRRAEARRRDDERLAEQRRRDEAAHAEEQRRRAAEALAQRQADDARALRDRQIADERAAENQAGLRAASDQRKYDLQAVADQRNADLWARTKRETEARDAAIDAAIRQRKEYDRARRVAAEELTRRQLSAGQRSRNDPFADMADLGVLMLHDLFFGGAAAPGQSATPEKASFRMSDLSDEDLQTALKHFDVAPFNPEVKPDEAELRKLAEEKEKKEAEQKRIRQEKWEARQREAREGEKFGLHEAWNSRLNIRVADVEYWRHVLVAFPLVEWRAAGSGASAPDGGACHECRLDPAGGTPTIFEGSPELWQEFIQGFRASSLFAEDGSLCAEVQDAISSGAQFHGDDVAMPTVVIRGGLESLDVIDLLRRRSLIEFNLKYPAANAPLSSAELCDKSRDGTIYDYTLERCREMAEQFAGAPRRHGMTLGTVMRSSILDPNPDDAELPMPGHHRRFW